VGGYPAAEVSRVTPGGGPRDGADELVVRALHVLSVEVTAARGGIDGQQNGLG